MGKMPSARPASHRLRLPAQNKNVKFPKIAAADPLKVKKVATAERMTRPRKITTATNDAIEQTR